MTCEFGGMTDGTAIRYCLHSARPPCESSAFLARTPSPTSLLFRNQRQQCCECEPTLPSWFPFLLDLKNDSLALGISSLAMLALFPTLVATPTNCQPLWTCSGTSHGPTKCFQPVVASLKAHCMPNACISSAVSLLSLPSAISAHTMVTYCLLLLLFHCDDTLGEMELL